MLNVTIENVDTATNKSLWEILVPTKSNQGKPYRTRYHRVWDAKVKAVSGGITILPVVHGQWLHGGELFKERMIPVRILATQEEINKIIDMTAIYYDQIAVLAYEVSNKVILRYR